MTYTIFTRAHDRVTTAAALRAQMHPDAVTHMDRAWTRSKMWADAHFPDIKADRVPMHDAADPVTILMDCSGSQQGVPAIAKTLAMQALGDLLSDAGVPFRMLGYTTNAWGGGEAQEDWRRAGQPANPGRLNGLLHVIFHEHGDVWADSRETLTFMAKEFFGKENIDGEALEWAASTSSGRIVFLTDGLPCDVSTEKANTDDPAFLIKHRNAVVSSLIAEGREIVTAMMVTFGSRAYGNLIKSYVPGAVVIPVDHNNPQDILDTVIQAIEHPFTPEDLGTKPDLDALTEI